MHGLIIVYIFKYLNIKRFYDVQTWHNIALNLVSGILPPAGRAMQKYPKIMLFSTAFSAHVQI